ncbi:unnamed protein product [Vitrella brassicaformis CCMP3155]|uniref:EF-hand domain-containing protein n=1 Tax=Vitrella brassicaformis (strain CCMP3155) TaxID=1169540 RepID=A0A0G4GS79_VITBC|nr:unnamed protein product [Vitrella brassicaformis CCMP3155]|eukprot:CEM33470.1 unnamed protein product [Vitrella brassicaformis CCMP3155]
MTDRRFHRDGCVIKKATSVCIENTAGAGDRLVGPKKARWLQSNLVRGLKDRHGQRLDPGGDFVDMLQRKRGRPIHDIFQFVDKDGAFCISRQLFDTMDGILKGKGGMHIVLLTGGEDQLEDDMKAVRHLKEQLGRAFFEASLRLLNVGREGDRLASADEMECVMLRCVRGLPVGNEQENMRLERSFSDIFQFVDKDGASSITKQHFTTVSSILSGGMDILLLTGGKDRVDGDREAVRHLKEQLGETCAH